MAIHIFYKIIDYFNFLFFRLNGIALSTIAYNKQFFFEVTITLPNLTQPPAIQVKDNAGDRGWYSFCLKTLTLPSSFHVKGVPWTTIGCTLLGIYDG